MLGSHGGALKAVLVAGCSCLFRCVDEKMMMTDVATWPLKAHPRYVVVLDGCVLCARWIAVHLLAGTLS
jgi:hypothetical protein